MKKVSVIVGKTTCKRDNQTTLLVRVEGKEMAGGKLLEMVKIVEHCNFCLWGGESTLIGEQDALKLISGVKNPLFRGEYIPPSKDFLSQIEQETQSAIKRGWDASKVGWRREALKIVLSTSLSTKQFTVNDFRDIIKASGFTTPDNRAMGGLMVTARNWKWIRPSGDEIVSKVGHKSKLQVWISNIYQEASRREKVEMEQPALF